MATLQSHILLIVLPLLGQPAATANEQAGKNLPAITQELDQLSSQDLANQYFGLIRSSRAAGTLPHPEKVLTIHTILEKRVAAKQTDAYGPFGAVLLLQCTALKHAGIQSADCPAAISNLKFAAADKSIDAMRRLSAAYADGICVTQSKYAAVDWLLKASVIYMDAGLREEAYAAAEEALTIVPDHPNAKALLLRLMSESAKDIPSAQRQSAGG